MNNDKKDAVFGPDEDSANDRFASEKAKTGRSKTAGTATASLDDADESSMEDVPVDEQKRKRKHIIFVAAAALVLLVIGVLLFRRTKGCCHRD